MIYRSNIVLNLIIVAIAAPFILIIRLFFSSLYITEEWFHDMSEIIESILSGESKK